MRCIAMALVLVMVSGCASVTTMQLKGHEIHILKTKDLFNPATTTVLEEVQGELRVLNAGQGGSIVEQFAIPVAIVAGGALVGKGMEKITNDVNPQITVTPSDALKLPLK